MSKKKFFAVFGVFTLLIVGIYIYYNHAGISADTSSARAVDTSYAVDSKTKWDQGALKNVDDSTGAAKMDTKHMWESNFTGWTQTNSIVTHPGYDGFEFDDWCLSQINRDGGDVYTLYSRNLSGHIRYGLNPLVSKPQFYSQFRCKF